MKVGTDGVLLGAWVPLPQSGMVLDAGTGTGLIALMMAQRSPDSNIMAIDTDGPACEEALENIQHSPWAGRVTVIHVSIQEHAKSAVIKYDLIVCNPPYFSNSLNSPSASRNVARHDVSLSMSEILMAAKTLLKQTGRLALILPASQYDIFSLLANDHGFFEWRKMMVFPVTEKPAHRVMSLWGFSPNERVIIESLTIESSKRHSYTPEYMALTRDFYLKSD